MEIGLLISVIIGLTAQNVTKKAYNKGGPQKKTFTFSLISCICACLFFVISGGFKFNFNGEVIPYSIAFGVSYGASVVFSFLSIMTGPLSLSVLISSYSLMIPTFYGLIFLNESVSIWFYVGLVLLASSLFLINYKPKSKDKESGVKITPLWLLFVFLGFVGNGVCSTVQVVQQKTFNGEYKSELMIIALLIVIAVLAILTMTTERKSFVAAVRYGGLLAVLCGIANGACNLLVMMLAVRMKASLMYPLLSAGNIILTSLFSIFVYKEKLSRMQFIGLALGIAAVVFINI